MSSRASNLALTVSLVALTAGEALAANTMVSLAADNTLYSVLDPNNAANAYNWRPAQQAATANGVAARSTPAFNLSGLTNNNTAQSSSPNVAIACQLSSGNIASISQNATSNILSVQVTDNTGKIVLAPITVGTTGGTALNNICALTGGGFVVAFVSAGGVITLQPFNAAGVPQTTQTVSAQTTGQSIAGLAGLSNGGFAVTFRNSSAIISHAVYSATGALATAAAVASGAVANSTANPVITSLSGGGYALFYQTSTTATAVATYSNLGAITGGPTVSIVVGNSAATIILNMVTLTGGGFGVALTGTSVTSGQGISLAAYNATAVLQGAIQPVAPTIAACPAMLCPATLSGGFYAAFGVAGMSVAKISAAGAQIGSNLTVNAGSVTLAQNYIAPQPDDGIVLMGYVNASSPIYFFPITSGLTQTLPSFSTPGYTAANTGYQMSCFVAAAGTNYPGMSLVYVVNSSGGNQHSDALAYAVQKSTLVGVTQASAAAAAQVNVQYIGKIQLAAPWLQAFIGNGVAGNEVSVIGNQVTMTTLLGGKLAAFVGGISGSSITFNPLIDCMVSIIANSASGTITVNGTIIGSGVLPIYFVAGSSITVTAGGTGATALISYVEV